MRYVEARIEEYKREEAYRIYITKSLQLIPQNKFITVSFDEVLKPRKVDKRTSDEIIIETMIKAGLKFGE